MSNYITDIEKIVAREVEIKLAAAMSMRSAIIRCQHCGFEYDLDTDPKIDGETLLCQIDPAAETCPCSTFPVEVDKTHSFSLKLPINSNLDFVFIDHGGLRLVFKLQSYNPGTGGWYVHNHPEHENPEFTIATCWVDGDYLGGIFDGCYCLVENGAALADYFENDILDILEPLAAKECDDQEVDRGAEYLAAKAEYNADIAEGE